MPTICAALLFFAPHIAFATSVIALSENDMTARADVVVLGSVVSNDVQMLHGRITTRTQMQVHHVIKGAHEGAVVTVEVPGGRLNGLTTTLSGAPRFNVGDMVVGFFERHDDGTLHPLGLNYGIYRIKGPAFGTERSFDGLTMLRAPGPRNSTGTVALSGEPLMTLLDRLHKTVAQQVQTRSVP